MSFISHRFLATKVGADITWWHFIKSCDVCILRWLKRVLNLATATQAINSVRPAGHEYFDYAISLLHTIMEFIPLMTPAR
jgi:hypothetical protein